MYWRDPFLETWKRYRYLLGKHTHVTRAEAMILAAQEVQAGVFWRTSYDMYQMVAALRYETMAMPRITYLLTWEGDTLILAQDVHECLPTEVEEERPIVHPWWWTLEE